MTRTAPTPMQWRCLVMLDRHDGNRKAAAHAVGITDWTFGYHLREMCRREGHASVHRLLMAHADELAQENGRRRKRKGRAVTLGQQCLGIVA